MVQGVSVAHLPVTVLRMDVERQKRAVNAIPIVNKHLQIIVW